MKVNVGGQDYEIGGIIYGQAPAWKLIKHAGQSMTAESFNSLPDQDKARLFEHVQQHIRQLNGG